MNERRAPGQWLLLLAAAGVAVFLTWRMLQPFLSVLVWAAVLALLFYPLHRRILLRIRRPALAAALSILVVLISHLDARQQAALSAGADMFISKSETPERVAERLQSAVDGLRL